MKFARYWTRADAEATNADGEPIRVRARGWSDDSLESARAKALDVAQRVANRVAGGFGKSQQYSYGDRPLPEPQLRSFGDGAIVTRNLYGALVLNTNRLMFVDIDGPTRPAGPAPSLLSGFSLLFRKSASAAPTAVSDPAIQAMDSIVQRHSLSARVYQTAAGHRLLITSAVFHAGSPDSEALLREFGSDPLYIRLCKLQESFRARLTPKPWRCGYHAPRIEFPFEDPADEENFHHWEKKYNIKIAQFATCRFVAALGPNTVLPEFDQIIYYHDQETKAQLSFPLA